MELRRYLRQVRHLNSTWGADVDADSTVGKSWKDPLQPFSDGLVAGAAAPRGEFYTNAELVDVLDPDSASLPYIWDDYGLGDCVVEMNHSVYTRDNRPDETDDDDDA